MSRYFYENGDQAIPTREILVDVEKRLDEYDKRAALERGGAEPATVERFRVYGFKESQYCVSPTGADDQYKNHFARFVIGEVVATRRDNGTWLIDDGDTKVIMEPGQWQWIVGMNLKCGSWERTNEYKNIL